MKHASLLLLLSLLAAEFQSHAADARGVIKFESVPVPQLLSAYKAMSGLELVIDSRAKTLISSVTVQSSAPLTKTEALKLIEKALVEQAGVVITPLDDRQASVTFNDALPITRAKKP